MWVLLVILSAVLLVHAPSIDNHYVYDDRSSAMPEVNGLPHPMVAEVQPLSEYFSSHYLRGANETSRGYRPVTVLSYALVYHLAGRSLEASAVRAGDPDAKEASALPQHLLNVLLQVLNTWLVWLLLLQVVGRTGRSGHDGPILAATAVFGLHAIHSGPVASIVGRGELLAFTFGAAAAVLYLTAVRRTSFARTCLLIASSALLFLAFCSKESALAWAFFLPCLWLARHWSHGAGRPRIATNLLLWGAVAIPAVALFLWLYFRTVWHLGYLPSYLSNPLLHELPGVALPEVRWMTALMLWGYGLLKVVWPFSLCCNYSPNTFDLVHDVGDLRLIGAVIMLAGILIGGLWSARRQPLLFLAMASFLGFSFITSNLPFGLETIFAERLYYTPSLSLSFLVAWLLGRGWGSIRWLIWVAFAAWLAASAWTAAYRMEIWRDNYTLFTHDARVHPRSLSLLQMAAGAYQTHQPAQHDKYLQCVARILEIEPGFPFALKARGRELVAAGDLDGAMAVLTRGLASPLLMIVDKANDVPQLHHDLGVVLLAKGRRQQARKHFQDALDFAPNYHPAREWLMRLSLEDDDVDKVERLLAKGIEIDARHDPWKIFAGVLAHRRGNHREAAEILDDILPRAPMERTRFSDWLALVDSLSRIGRGRDGLQRLEQSIQMGGLPPEHRREVLELRKRLQDQIR